MFDNLFFKPMEFINNLGKMGIGMLCIFIVIAVIMIATIILNKVFSGKGDGEE